MFTYYWPRPQTTWSVTTTSLESEETFTKENNLKSKEIAITRRESTSLQKKVLTLYRPNFNSESAC